MVRRARIVCAVAIGWTAGCYQLGSYVCTSEDNCIDGGRRGVCEPTGFCSYPDDDCSSGQRYDDLAGDGLAGSCVEPDDGSGTTDAGTGTDGSEGTDGTDGETPTCIDEDGDGFGQGELCSGPDCDDDNPHATQDCLYIGPDGNDEGSGTRDDPWLTFTRAVSALQPGSSLVVLSGTYDLAVHGPLHVSCADDAAINGTPQMPIFVRAEEERQAHIATEGMGVGVELEGCAYWRLRGLRVSGADAAGAPSGILVILRESTDLELRRLLLHDGNRYHSAPLLWSTGGRDLLIEDTEAYSFTSTAFRVTGSGNVLRRAYVHGRGRQDLRGCVDGGTDDEPECSAHGQPDRGIVIGDEGIVENSIVESTAIAIVGSAVVGTKVLGSAVFGGTHGVVFSSDADATVPQSTDIVIEHIVGIGMESRAVYLRSTGAVTLRNVTAVGASAFRSDRNGGTDGTPCPTDGCVLSGANLLSIDALSDGMQFTDGTGGIVTHSNSIGSKTVPYRPDTEAIDDDEGLWQRSLSVPAPRIGLGADQCLASVPDDSAMAGAGQDGEDIGANLLYRYEYGILGDEPLWDPQTGAFPCGAVIEGVNDDPAISCIGMHERLHVGTESCPLPYE